MNAGFSNLDSLKKHLLPSTMVGETRFDALITDIGVGTAAFIGQFCNRNFQRMAGAVSTFAADRVSFTVDRYPIEQVTKIEGKNKEVDGWEDLGTVTDVLESISKTSGIIFFDEARDPGAFWNQLRFTYDGGFWWNTAEPDDESEAMPATATALPMDLRLAWQYACRDAWARIDKLGIGVVDKPDEQSSLFKLEISKQVMQMVFPYKQIQPI